MSFLKNASAILGMNARNLEYIGRYNNKASKRFADDKLYTKTFLQSRDIGVAKVYHVIKSYQDLEKLDFKNLPSSFVIKPNHGFGGDGIMVITEKTKAYNFKTVSGLLLRKEDLFLHIASILDGKYALNGSFDQAILEERLEVDESLQGILTVPGLPDIRIIVFQYVPIIAMLRIPTKESEGKGNLQLGAIGVGIDIATGKTTYGYQNGKFIKKFSNGEPVAGMQIEDWDDILLSASRIQQSTHVGYLGVDLVQTKTGIKVLEMNARPGLKIQLCNKIALRKRLERVAEHKVHNPDEGVALAKRLFTQKAKDFSSPKKEKEKKPIIGLKEPVTVYTEGVSVFYAKIDPFAPENIIRSNLPISLENGLLDMSIQNTRITLPVKKGTIAEPDCDMILGGRFLGNFLIDVSRVNKVDFSQIAEINERMLLNLDKKLAEIDEKIAFMSYFRPQNVDEIKETFLQHRNFNPQFVYKEFSEDMYDEFSKDINKLPRSIDHFLMPLYEKKIQEMKLKLELIQSRNSEHLAVVSEKMFGTVDYALYKEAMYELQTAEYSFDESKTLSSLEVKKRIQKVLSHYEMNHWNIQVIKNASSNMSVSKQGVIFIKEEAVFSENHLKSLIAHEIETHVFRSENARLQKYKLFQRGTANYLETEEGLAISNQNFVDTAQGHRNKRTFLRIVGSFMGKKMSFLELFLYGMDALNLDAETAFKNCLRVKRGLYDTSLHSAFTKDTIYFTGTKKIQEFLKTASPEDISLLYAGKFSLDSLDMLRSEDIEITPPRFVSAYISQFIGRKNGEKNGEL
jgi:alpha-L-glutamate ligase-like protein